MLSEVVILPQLPSDVLKLLMQAKRSVDARLRFGENPAAVYETAREFVRRASKEVPPGWDDREALERLSDANAVVVAAAAASLENFPKELSVEALMPLSDLFGSIGREHEASGKHEDALERYVLGLRILITLQAHRPYFRLNKIVFWLSSRVAGVVGHLAAEKAIGPRDTLIIFDKNMEQFVRLFEDVDFEVPRSMCLVAYARHTLQLGRERVQLLREELLSEAERVRPQDQSHKARLTRELDAILAQAAQIMVNAHEPAFRWDLTPTQANTGEYTPASLVYPGETKEAAPPARRSQPQS